MTEQGSNPQTPRAPLTLCPLWGKMAAGDAAGFVVEGGRRGGGEGGGGALPGRTLASPGGKLSESTLSPPSPQYPILQPDCTQCFRKCFPSSDNGPTWRPHQQSSLNAMNKFQFGLSKLDIYIASFRNVLCHRFGG